MAQFSLTTKDQATLPVPPSSTHLVASYPGTVSSGEWEEPGYEATHLEALNDTKMGLGTRLFLTPAHITQQAAQFSLTTKDQAMLLVPPSSTHLEVLDDPLGRLHDLPDLGLVKDEQHGGHAIQDA